VGLIRIKVNQDQGQVILPTNELARISDLANFKDRGNLKLTDHLNRYYTNSNKTEGRLVRYVR